MSRYAKSRSETWGLLSLWPGKKLVFFLKSLVVVTLSPPTSKAGVRSSARSQVGKLVVACRWSAVYSTEP